MVKNKKNNNENKNLVRKQIIELLKKAKDCVKTDTAGSRDFVRKARNSAMHHRLRISREYKRTFCKKCNSYLLTGFNSSVRINNGKIIIKCFNCKNLIKIVV